MPTYTRCCRSEFKPPVTGLTSYDDLRKKAIERLRVKCPGFIEQVQALPPQKAEQLMEARRRLFPNHAAPARDRQLSEFGVFSCSPPRESVTRTVVPLLLESMSSRPPISFTRSRMLGMPTPMSTRGPSFCFCVTVESPLPKSLISMMRCELQRIRILAC